MPRSALLPGLTISAPSRISSLARGSGVPMPMLPLPSSTRSVWFHGSRMKYIRLLLTWMDQSPWSVSMKSICGALPLICNWPLNCMRDSGSGDTPWLATSRSAPLTCSCAPGATVPTPTWPVVWSMNSRGLPSPSVMPRPGRPDWALRGSLRGLSARPKAGLASLKFR